MQFVELLPARCWLRTWSGQLIENPTSPPLNIRGQRGLTRFRDVIQFDIDPMREDVAIGLERGADCAACLCKLHIIKGRVHVLRSLDTGVIAVQRLADSATEPVH